MDRAFFIYFLEKIMKAVIEFITRAFNEGRKPVNGQDLEWK